MLYACVITHLFSDENLLSSKKKAKKKKEKKRRKRKNIGKTRKHEQIVTFEMIRTLER